MDALYLRVSSDRQTTENQFDELITAARAGDPARDWDRIPKQLDRFRDRHSPAGAKDDGRDAFVLADSLRTDPSSFHYRSRRSPMDRLGSTASIITSRI